LDQIIDTDESPKTSPKKDLDYIKNRGHMQISNHTDSDSKSKSKTKSKKAKSNSPSRIIKNQSSLYSPKKDLEYIKQRYSINSKDNINNINLSSSKKYNNN